MPATEPVITEIAKIPGLKKLLSYDIQTVKNAKRLLMQGQDMARLKKQNWDEQQAFFAAQKSPLFKETVNKYVEMLWKATQAKAKL
jgi:hypothetical protein